MAKSKHNSKQTKNKLIAAILAIFFGDLGIHKFYLGRVEWGLLYLLFSWTGIPMVLGWIEGIVYLCTSDKSFQQKYS